MPEKPSLDELRDLALLGDLSDAALALIREHSTRLSFQAEQLLLAEGERNDRLYFVRNGKIVIWRASSAGRLVLTEVHSGGTMGEVTFLEPGVASANATGADPGEVVTLHHRVLESLEADHPADAARLFRRIGITLKNRLVDTTALMLTHTGIRQALEEMEELRSSVGNLLGGG